MDADRRKRILEKILIQKSITVKDLAKELYASESSIRRDLAELEKEEKHKAALEEKKASRITKTKQDGYKN